MIFIYIIICIGLILMTSGLFELIAPKLEGFLDRQTIKTIDWILYNLCLYSVYIMIAIIAIFIVGGVLGTIVY